LSYPFVALFVDGVFSKKYIDLENVFSYNTNIEKTFS
jgi:hypothetical protein